jgi:hypothetical protein
VESRPMSRTSSGLFNRDSAFDCNICMEIPTDPVVTMCGHLYWYASRPHFDFCSPFFENLLLFDVFDDSVGPVCTRYFLA